ncbi:MAG: alginate lyase family protein [Candidatus Omnitrophota bacterium]
MNILGQAYVLTKNKKYAEEFVNQVNDWIENNPVYFGVNWTCAMDVAIRAANWLVGVEYFLEGKILGRDFLKRFYASIYEHAKFILDHLEYSPLLTKNHYLSNIVGLFFIAVHYPFYKESRKWRDFALTELIKEMQKQVYDDGCNFEASTSYHRLTLEMFFYAELLGKRANIKFPLEYSVKLKKMFEFSLYCVKPDGAVPQIGDNDSGRFLVFAQRPGLEHKYLLSLAAVYYGDSQFKLSSFDFDEEAFWLFGESGKNIHTKLSYRDTPLKSRSFPNAGWYIIRHNEDYRFISRGPNGQNGSGGHAHNDKLSFELMLDKNDVFIDPGTYIYIPYPEWRNKFRSTRYHNTVSIDEVEQNDISGKLFTMRQGVRICSSKLEEKGDVIVFQGKIEYINEKIFHTRTIVYHAKNGKVDVIDLILSKNKEPRHYSLNLFLSKSSQLQGSINSISINSQRYSLISNKLNWRQYREFYSPEYGIKEDIICLSIN